MTNNMQTSLKNRLFIFKVLKRNDLKNLYDVIDFKVLNEERLLNLALEISTGVFDSFKK